MIDLDHNATTPLDPRVEEAMRGALRLGNPSSAHARGRAARLALDGARRSVAQALGCEPGEVVFTSGGSEANALALKGAFVRNRARSSRVLLSAIEHPSVRESARDLRELGAELVELPVGPEGLLRLEALREALAGGAAVAALMWANNETGVVQPVAEAYALCQAAGVPLLVDAVQAAGKLPLGRPLAHADLVSLSAHKFYGPQGAGALLVRRGLQLWPLAGGHQERGRRGGTESVASAVGLARALELAQGSLEADAAHVSSLRDAFEAGLLARLPWARLHGQGAPRVGNTSSACFPGCDGEALLIGLDLAGVCASLGAACASGSLSPSHVLLAMGVSPADARASLRFSFGRDNTAADVERVLDLLAELAPRTRRGPG